MPRKINFTDGFESSTEPTIGNLVASSLVCYDNDAEYEASEQGSPQAGNLYYNKTTCKIRYYDHNLSIWKDSDQESLDAIVILIAEQLVQDGLIQGNADDIVLVEQALASYILSNDAAVALNTAKVSFPEAPIDGETYVRKDAGWEQLSIPEVIDDLDDVLTSGEVIDVTVYDQNTTGTFSDFGGTNFAAATFEATGSSASVNQVEVAVQTDTVTTGTMVIHIAPVKVDDSPDYDNLFATSDSIDRSIIGTSQTNIIFNFSTPFNIVSGTKYAVIYDQSGGTGGNLKINNTTSSVGFGSIYFSGPGTLSSFTFDSDKDAYIVMKESDSVPAVQNGDVLIYDGSRWIPSNKLDLLAGSIDPQDKIFIAQHREPFNVGGGTSVAGTQIRDLNHVDQSATWASLDIVTNIITLQPGRYIIDFHSMAFYVARHRCLLSDITNSVVYNGSSAFTSNQITPGGVSTTSRGSKLLTVSTTTQITLNHYTQGSWVTSGLGVATLDNTGDNIYAGVKITKLGDI